MARPAGAVLVDTGTSAELRMKSDFTGQTQAAYFIHRLQPMPQDYQTDNFPGTYMSHDILRQVKIAASTTLTEYWQVGRDFDWAFATNPHTKTGAFDGELEDAQVQYPLGKKMNQFPDVKYCLSVYKFESSSDNGVTNQCDIRAVAFHAKNDDSYTGTGVEMLRRDTANQRLYAPDMPVSAWHIMYGLMETMEKMIYENRPAYCIPLFGSPGDA